MAILSNREIKAALDGLRRAVSSSTGAIVGDVPSTGAPGLTIINSTTGNICVFDNSNDCVPISETVFFRYASNVDFTDESQVNKLAGKVTSQGDVDTFSELPFKADGTEYDWRGIFFGTTVSTDPTDYVWTKLRGPIGLPGTNGANVLVVYADTGDLVTNSQSTIPGSNEYVAYFEYDGSTPSLPIRSGITFIKFVGTATSVFPIYADDGLGNGQQFEEDATKKYVTFFEATTSPSLPVSGEVFVLYIGPQGVPGADGTSLERIFLNDDVKPDTPTGGDFSVNPPVVPTGGWTDDPIDGDDQRWYSEATIGESNSQEITEATFNGSTGTQTEVSAIKEDGFFDISGSSGTDIAAVNETTTITTNGNSGTQTEVSAIKEDGFFDISGLAGTDIAAVNETTTITTNGTSGGSVVPAVAEVTRLGLPGTKAGSSSGNVVGVSEETDITFTGVSGAIVDANITWQFDSAIAASTLLLDIQSDTDNSDIFTYDGGVMGAIYIRTDRGGDNAPADNEEGVRYTTAIGGILFVYLRNDITYTTAEFVTAATTLLSSVNGDVAGGGTSLPVAQFVPQGTFTSSSDTITFTATDTTRVFTVEPVINADLTMTVTDGIAPTTFSVTLDTSHAASPITGSFTTESNNISMATQIRTTVNAASTTDLTVQPVDTSITPNITWQFDSAIADDVLLIDTLGDTDNSDIFTYDGGVLGAILIRTDRFAADNIPADNEEGVRYTTAGGGLLYIFLRNDITYTTAEYVTTVTTLLSSVNGDVAGTVTSNPIAQFIPQGTFASSGDTITFTSTDTTRVFTVAVVTTEPDLTMTVTSSNYNIVELDSDTVGDVTDITVVFSGGGGSTAAAAVDVAVQGVDGVTRLATAYAMTSSGSHSPSMVASTFTNDATALEAIAEARAHFLGTVAIGGYNAPSAITSNAFDVTNTTAGVDTPDLMFEITTAGTGGDLVATDVVQTQGVNETTSGTPTGYEVTINGTTYNGTFSVASDADSQAAQIATFLNAQS